MEIALPELSRLLRSFLLEHLCGLVHTAAAPGAGVTATEQPQYGDELNVIISTAGH